MLRKIIIYLFFLCLLNIPLLAQEKNISGFIFNESKSALPYASIFISNKPNIGTFSDEKGFFSLKAELTDTLFISHIGYESIKICANDFKDKVVLVQKILSLKEVTVEANKSNREKFITHKKLGLYWTGSDAKAYTQGQSNYALLIPNEIRNEGKIEKVHYKISHRNNAK